MRWNDDWRHDWRQSWRGIDEDTSLVPGFGLGGAATFVLDLENLTVSLRWPTPTGKAYSGVEQRVSRNDRPKERYAGSSILLGANPVSIRTTLAKYAAMGSVFLLGLPHEELLLTDDADGSTVYVDADELALTDPKKPGQRVVVVRENDDGELESIEAVIQEASGGSILLDRDPGDCGLVGGRIMPAVPVYLEPQQDFARWPVEAERWDIRARAASFDFAMTLASLALGPLTDSPGLAGAVVTARYAGAAPTLTIIESSENGAGYLDEDADGNVTAYVEASVTTIQNFIDLLAASTYLTLAGAVNPTDTMLSGDAFASQQLTGGDTQGPVGTGTTLASYNGRSLWDREIVIKGTVADGLQALTEIIDYDGVPYALGKSDQADWYRAVVFHGHDREAWQWFKLFLATVKGPQKAFYLSTWRDDLPCIDVAGSTLTVEGDVGAWYPTQRQHLHVRQANGVHVYCAVTDATDNGDGTWDVETDAAGFTDPTEVSWLELCRFEKPDFDVTWGEYGFEISTVARVVQR